MPISPLKSPLGFAALAFLAASMSSPATVTLQFSTSTLQATNWANAGDVGGTNLIWGIIVDTNRNGLSPSSYLTAGIDYGNHTSGPGRVPQALTDGNGVLTDDVLFMSSISMSIVASNFNGVDGAQTGQNRISLLPSVPLLAGANEGDPFYLVWFDRTGSPSGTPQLGERFGVFGDPALTLPADGSVVSYAPVFTGADPLRQMTYQFAPEPATAVLSLLGALGLMRRRRC